MRLSEGIYCNANFSTVFGQNFRGRKSRGGNASGGAPWKKTSTTESDEYDDSGV